MIELKQLTKSFLIQDEEVVVVDRLSFQVPEGEVFGLLGPNGAGKTTTMRMILGLLKPTSGDALINNQSVSIHPDLVKRKIGLVSASAGLYQWLTPREILLFFGDLYQIPSTIAQERAAQLARLMQIESFLDQRAATLSTGQQQRVNLARALIHDPQVVLMDEPTRGLDVVGSSVVFDYIAHLKEQGKSVILCTHRLDEASRICTRFGLLHLGQLRHIGRLEELQQETDCESIVDMFLQMMNESVSQSETDGSERGSGFPWEVPGT